QPDKIRPEVSEHGIEAKATRIGEEPARRIGKVAEVKQSRKIARHCDRGRGCGANPANDERVFYSEVGRGGLMGTHREMLSHCSTSSSYHVRRYCEMLIVANIRIRWSLVRS